eukprot:scpid91902/ scgid5452/ 
MASDEKRQQRFSQSEPEPGGGRKSARRSQFLPTLTGQDEGDGPEAGPAASGTAANWMVASTAAGGAAVTGGGRLRAATDTSTLSGGDGSSSTTTGTHSLRPITGLFEVTQSISRKFSSSQPPEEIPEEVLFHAHCEQGVVSRIAEMLKKGGDVDKLLKKRLGFEGLMPIHTASSHGHPDVIDVSAHVRKASPCVRLSQA